MPAENKAEYWSQYAKNYHEKIKDLLSPPTDSLLDQLNSLVPFSSPDTYVLDDGAGSGNTTIKLKKRYPDVKILAIDTSDGMLSMLRDAASEHPDWTPKIEIRVANAEDLQLDDNVFSHIVSVMVLIFCDPYMASKEMYRVLRPGGVVAVGTIASPTPTWRPLWQATVRSYYSQKEHYDERWVDYEAPFPFHVGTQHPEQMETMMQDAGFVDIETRIFPSRYIWPQSTAEEAVDLFYHLGRENPGIAVLLQGFPDEDVAAMRPTVLQEYRKLYGDTSEKQMELVLITTARKAV